MELASTKQAKDAVLSELTAEQILKYNSYVKTKSTSDVNAINAHGGRYRAYADGTFYSGKISPSNLRTGQAECTYASSDASESITIYRGLFEDGKRQGTG